MIGLEDRQTLVRHIDEAHAAGARLRPACEVAGMTLRTLQRWRRWWREDFMHTPLWQAMCARFMPPVSAQGLPGELLARFAGETTEALQRLQQAGLRGQRSSGGQVQAVAFVAAQLQCHIFDQRARGWGKLVLGVERAQQMQATVQHLERTVANRTQEIERLKLLIAKLQRMQFGRRSEKLVFAHSGS